MRPAGDGRAVVTAEPLLGIRDGVTTPTLDSYSEQAGWRRWHNHLFGGPALVISIGTLGSVVGLSVPAIYSPLPLWAARISNVIGAEADHLVECARAQSPEQLTGSAILEFTRSRGSEGRNGNPINMCRAWNVSEHSCPLHCQLGTPTVPRQICICSQGGGISLRGVSAFTRSCTPTGNGAAL